MNTYDRVLENQKNNFNYLIDSIDKDKLNELANILIEYKNENIFLLEWENLVIFLYIYVIY